mgnify:CR=1 FL=1
MAFNKVLIANRGEIALRVIRACKEMGLKTVAVYSQADAEALHVRFADEAVCIGPPRASDSYLSIPAILSAAEVSHADAIHPGYGFLSENAGFAESVVEAGYRFIGPSAESMRLMGDKVSARAAMKKAGIPLLPGTGALDTEDALLDAAKRVGFPLIIKASAGGGGRGMKIVEHHGDLVTAWATARKEAEAGFANSEVYLERYVSTPRHIEIQILADSHGNVVHLFDRECSIQRRHQKLVEEAPSPALSAKKRAEIGALVVKACETINYEGAGTFEFLLDENEALYFMEMNTRIQVEHTVTEQVTGIDLVQAQLSVAQGELLPFAQQDISVSGHSIEVRINAEDPDTFAPSPGQITALNFPGGPGIRVDAAIYEQYKVPPHYDSMIAKLIVTAKTRDAAVLRLDRALDEFIVEGIRTNIPLYKRIVDHADFKSAHLDTRFLERL